MKENIRSYKEGKATAEEFILTPEIVKKLFESIEKEDVRFTAEEIRNLSLNSDTLFTDEELLYIIDKELEREILDIDSELIDACLWAIENGLYNRIDI